jgi:hypothetical protein
MLSHSRPDQLAAASLPHLQGVAKDTEDRRFMADAYFGMQGCLSRGKRFERLARDILEREGYETRESTTEEDVYKHTDFWSVGKDGRVYGVDAKARKSLKRGDAAQDEWTFVEWRNTHGYPGWLVKGCDILCFERLEDILLVKREDLLDFCTQRTNRELFVDKASDAKYCVYSRPNRKDVISLFRFSDLDIPCRTFNK